MADRTILLDGWSKTYAMTGWRLGFGVFPAALVEPVTRLAINSVSCTSAFSQYGAIAALDGPQDGVAAMVAEFGRRRDVIVAGLNAIDGVSCVEPQGAFYAFPNITGTGLGGRRAGGPAAARGGRGGAGRHRVRPIWRGVSPDLVRQLGRQHRGRAGRDQIPTSLLSCQLSVVTEGNRVRPAAAFSPSRSEKTTNTAHQTPIFALYGDLVTPPCLRSLTLSLARCAHRARLRRAPGLAHVDLPAATT